MLTRFLYRHESLPLEASTFLRPKLTPVPSVEPSLPTLETVLLQVYEGLYTLSRSGFGCYKPGPNVKVFFWRSQSNEWSFLIWARTYGLTALPLRMRQPICNLYEAGFGHWAMGFWPWLQEPDCLASGYATTVVSRCDRGSVQVLRPRFAGQDAAADACHVESCVFLLGLNTSDIIIPSPY